MKKKLMVACACFITLCIGGGFVLQTQDINASTNKLKSIQTCVNGHENCNGECAQSNHNQENMHHNAHNETHQNHNNGHH